MQFLSKDEIQMLPRSSLSTHPFLLPFQAKNDAPTPKLSISDLNIHCIHRICSFLSWYEILALVPHCPHLSGYRGTFKLSTIIKIFTAPETKEIFTRIGANIESIYLGAKYTPDFDDYLKIIEDCCPNLKELNFWYYGSPLVPRDCAVTQLHDSYLYGTDCIELVTNSEITNRHFDKYYYLKCLVLTKCLLFNLFNFPRNEKRKEEISVLDISEFGASSDTLFLKIIASMKMVNYAPITIFFDDIPADREKVGLKYKKFITLSYFVRGANGYLKQ